MNTISTTICRVRVRLADSLCHIGWGFMGQHCDCGSTWPDMNWLARITAKYVDDWPDDSDQPRTTTGRVCEDIGSWFYSMGCRLLSGPAMSRYFKATSNDNRLIDAEVEAMMRGDR